MLDYRRTFLPTLVVAAALVAAACGPGGTTAAPSAAPSASAPAGAPGGDFDFAKVQECLAAAGIDTPSRGSFAPPSGSFALPSGGFPQQPSGSFALPSGRFPGGGLNDPATIAALEACGIALPSAPTAP